MDNGKVNVPVDTGTSKDTTPSEVTKPPKKEGTPQLATVRQVFSFANTAKIQWYIIGSFCAAITSGAILPGTWMLTLLGLSLYDTGTMMNLQHTYHRLNLAFSFLPIASIFYFAVALQDLAADTDSYDFRATIREISFAFMVFGVLLFASMTIQSSLMEMAAAEMTHELKTSWFAAIMRQDMAYFDAKDVSGDATIITINGAKYKKGVGRKLAESLQFFVSFVGSLAYSFWASWQTSLVTLLITPVMFASSLFLLKMNKSQTLRANATYAKAGSIVNMAVTSLRTILSLNAVERVIEMYQEATAEACQGAVSQVWLVGLATGCQLGSFLLSYVVITLFGSYLLFDNVRDSGCDPSGTTDGVPACDPSGADVFGALMGVTVAAFVLPQVSVALDAFIGARAACYPALCAINRKSTEIQTTNNRTEKVSSSYVIDSSSDRGVKLPSLIGDLEFRSVRFSYPTRDADVFRNFSLQIPSGKTVALVGPSGCGKSTAMQLLERFYDPLDGTLTLDGVDLREINVKWLRQQIGLVSQEPKLFAMSIRDNIAIGSPNASQGDIERAASMANAYDFIQSFPQGFDTIVGEEGAQLSGGQRQRIALARVLVRNVKILLLDEATSALDSESEASVQKALDNLMRMKTMTTFG
jgi:ATP-binding cassette subfamily B (MDR/TAP) protein 1